MKKELLTSELSRGEKWEGKDKRIIEVCPSCDNRGSRPSVVFSIWEGDGKTWKDQFFFNLEDAKEIGEALIGQANWLYKEWDDGKKKDYTSV